MTVVGLCATWVCLSSRLVLSVILFLLLLRLPVKATLWLASPLILMIIATRGLVLMIMIILTMTAALPSLWWRHRWWFRPLAVIDLRFLFSPHRFATIVRPLRMKLLLLSLLRLLLLHDDVYCRLCGLGISTSAAAVVVPADPRRKISWVNE